jgi:hypothetical protein
VAGVYAGVYCDNSKRGLSMDENLAATLGWVAEVRGQYRRLNEGGKLSNPFLAFNIKEQQTSHLIEQRHIERQDYMQQTLLGMTKALRTDSSYMKVIAVLTTLFLPGTFMAVRPPLNFRISLPNWTFC